MSDGASSARYAKRPADGRERRDRAFAGACVSVAALAVCLLVVLLVSIGVRGADRLSVDFLTGINSEADAEAAGFGPAIVGSLCLLVLCALAAIPLGVGTAILLEEYRPTHPLLRRMHGVVQANITNLAGVPSIVYGILGYTAFATMFDAVGTPDDPGFSFGTAYVAEYRDLADNPVYAALDGPGTELPLAAAGLGFFADIDLTEPVAARVVTPEEIEPLRAQLDGAFAELNRSLRSGVNGARPSRRAPPVISAEDAVRLSERALAGVAFQGPRDAYEQATAQTLAGLDGVSNNLAIARAIRALVRDLEDREFRAAGAPGLIEAGAAPQLRQNRSWYYFQLPLGRSVLAGGLTLALVVLPIVIVSSQEAIRAVPRSQRDAALALGGTRWQSIGQVVLPAAAPGICTGTILAMSRAIGEAAPILLLAFGFIPFTPVFREGGSLMDSFTAMPLQIFQWAGNPGDAFQSTAAAGIVVLLAVLLSFNSVAVYLRQRYQGAAG
ncbi:MAG: ABC transporter permease subunit [Planctomycetota bacterium]